VANKWTPETVSAHFEEAVSTLKRLPPVKVRGYFNSWPEVVYSTNELVHQERISMRLRATPEAISCLEQTFDWMAWLEISERKLIWKRAAHVRWKTICVEFGCDRSTAWRKWVIACVKISERLNTQNLK